MKIAVSACLLGVNCKYNGGNNYSQKVAEFVKGHEVTAVCPELSGGLGVPRKPAEIVGGTVLDKDLASVDREFREGAAIALKQVLDAHAKLAILQPRSPSCGVKQIYDGSFRGNLIDGQGVFAKMLRENGILLLDAEDMDHPESVAAF